MSAANAESIIEKSSQPVNFVGNLVKAEPLEDEDIKVQEYSKSKIKLKIGPWCLSEHLRVIESIL